MPLKKPFKDVHEKMLAQAILMILLIDGGMSFMEFLIISSTNKDSLQTDLFNVNSNEFLISADAIVSDIGAQRSMQLMLR
jgi:hypothetical protein